MRVLVTGGAGFIGSHVAGLLVSRGMEVSVLDDLSSGPRENVPVQASFHQVDIEDADAVREIVKREQPEAVIHLAAQINVRVSIEKPVLDARKNVVGTLNVLEALRESGGGKFVFASTGGAIYGEQEYSPADEEHPTRPESPYALSKLAAERYIRFYDERYGIPGVTLRLANVYGPRQDPHGEAGVVAIFARKLLRGERPVVFGDGRQTRDFVYAADVADGFLRALEARAGIYNIGTGVETSVLDVLQLIAKAGGRPADPEHADPIPGELRRSCIRFDKARQELGWTPQVPLAEGIERTVRYFREAPDA